MEGGEKRLEGASERLRPKWTEEARSEKRLCVAAARPPDTRSGPECGPCKVLNCMLSNELARSAPLKTRINVAQHFKAAYSSTPAGLATVYRVSTT